MWMICIMKDVPFNQIQSTKPTIRVLSPVFLSSSLVQEMCLVTELCCTCCSFISYNVWQLFVWIMRSYRTLFLLTLRLLQFVNLLRTKTLVFALVTWKAALCSWRLSWFELSLDCNPKPQSVMLSLLQWAQTGLSKYGHDCFSYKWLLVQNMLYIVYNLYMTLMSNNNMAYNFRSLNVLGDLKCQECQCC